MPFQSGVFSNIGLYLLYNIVASLPVLLISLPVHECAHGFVAYLLGDNTAKNQRRLTLNPLRHLDPIGSIGILFVGFGWARPVPINPYNFRHRKADMALTALAGPLSNLLMGFVALALIDPLVHLTGGAITADNLLAQFLIRFASLNVGLCVFNLIPIPPLDGSRLLALLLPENMLASLERLGIVPALFIMFVFWRWISGPLNQVVMVILQAFWSFLYH